VMKALRELLVSGQRTLEPRPEVQDEYTEHYEREIAQMVWAHPSVQHSHFKNAEGKIFTISPWPIPTYWEWTKTFEPKDYVWA
jgi:4-hydroxyacetophenone monooxygenase